MNYQMISAALSLLAKTLPSTLRHWLRTDKGCAQLTNMWGIDR